MLEVNRQGSYKFSTEDRAMLVRKYVQSVSREGVSCSANTCGNLKVHQYVAGQAALVSELGTQELRQFGQKWAMPPDGSREIFARRRLRSGRRWHSLLRTPCGALPTGARKLPGRRSRGNLVYRDFGYRNRSLRSLPPR
jgi:hypothetical protein